MARRSSGGDRTIHLRYALWALGIGIEPGPRLQAIRLALDSASETPGQGRRVPNFAMRTLAENLGVPHRTLRKWGEHLTKVGFLKVFGDKHGPAPHRTLCPTSDLFPNGKTPRKRKKQKHPALVTDEEWASGKFPVFHRETFWFQWFANIEAIEAVMHRPGFWDLDRRDALVLVNLAAYVDDPDPAEDEYHQQRAGLAYPGRYTLMANIGVKDPRVVDKSIERLVEAGRVTLVDLGDRKTYYKVTGALDNPTLVKREFKERAEGWPYVAGAQRVQPAASEEHDDLPHERDWLDDLLDDDSDDADEWPFGPAVPVGDWLISLHDAWLPSTTLGVGAALAAISVKGVNNLWVDPDTVATLASITGMSVAEVDAAVAELGHHGVLAPIQGPALADPSAAEIRVEEFVATTTAADHQENGVQSEDGAHESAAVTEVPAASIPTKGKPPAPPVAAPPAPEVTKKPVQAKAEKGRARKEATSVHLWSTTDVLQDLVDRVGKARPTRTAQVNAGAMRKAIKDWRASGITSAVIVEAMDIFFADPNNLKKDTVPAWVLFRSYIDNREHLLRQDVKVTASGQPVEDEIQERWAHDPEPKPAPPAPAAPSTRATVMEPAPLPSKRVADKITQAVADLRERLGIRFDTVSLGHPEQLAEIISSMVDSGIALDDIVSAAERHIDALEDPTGIPLLKYLRAVKDDGTLLNDDEDVLEKEEDEDEPLTGIAPRRRVPTANLDHHADLDHEEPTRTDKCSQTAAEELPEVEHRGHPVVLPLVTRAPSPRREPVPA